jgi:predicted dehydrogenase
MSEKENLNELNRRDFLRGGSMTTFMMMMGAVELRAEDAPKATADEDDDKPGPPVNCAVIGCGTWGREIVRTLSRLPNAPIVALCDSYERNLSRAGNTADKAEKNAEFKKILENKAVQAVFIATPTHLHREIAVAALQAGKHVYCEAPLATTTEDAAIIAKAAKAAGKQIFQCGLLLRTNPIHSHVLQFVRTGVLGKSACARAQFHKRQSWRRTAPDADQEKLANWHLHKETSIGLAGEIGIHHLDSAMWFAKQRPISVTGFGSLIAWNDGRDVPDTVQAVIEFPGGARLIYDATLANSFEASYEVHSGTDCAIVIRENRAWIIKESDAPLMGWEVHARKEEFTPGKETAIALVANSTKLLAQGKDPSEAATHSDTPLYYALKEFIANINTTKAPSAGAIEGYEATVLAIKTNEAIISGHPITFQNEWFDLS